jgi:hypothetical protein
MKLTARGWQRDHGTNTLVKFDVDNPIDENDVSFFSHKKMYVDSDFFEDGYFHTIGFGVSGIRLGGDYLIKLHLTDEELVAILLRAFMKRKSEQLWAAIAIVFSKRITKTE